MSEEASPQEQKPDLEKNFAQQRKHYEKQIEQQRREYEDRLAKLEQERVQAKKYDDDDDNVSDEPYIDRRGLKRELSRFGQDIDKKIEQKAEEKARLLLEQERQGSFFKSNPDFNQIMTAEHIQKFAEKYPETAESLLEMPDGFARQKLIYRAMKDVGIHKKEEAKPSIQDKVNANRKPLFYQPSGVSSPAFAEQADFSPQGQKSAYEKMQSLLKNRRAY